MPKVILFLSNTLTSRFSISWYRLKVSPLLILTLGDRMINLRSVQDNYSICFPDASNFPLQNHNQVHDVVLYSENQSIYDMCGTLDRNNS